MCETRACKVCGEEKPLVMFSKSMTDGKVYYKWNCSKCISKLTVQRRTPEQKERKRAREREAAKNNPKAIERSKRSSAARNERLRIARNERFWADNIGAYSVIHWHKCEKCIRIKLFKRQERKDKLCAKCRKSENEKGTSYALCKTATCPSCKKEHLAKTTKSHCPECVQDKKREKLRLYKRKRKADYNDKTFRARCRKYGVRYEPVNRRMVYEKDKYKCYLCKCRVVISGEYRPDQATLDHILPLSLGGSHTYDNVRTCCMLCNSNRSNNVTKPVQIGLWCSA